jgi:hypothetical protein
MSRKDVGPAPAIDDLDAGMSSRYTTPPAASGHRRGATSSRAHELTSSPPVQPARPVQYTLRLSYAESDRLNSVARGIRQTLGRHVDQSELLRALVELAAVDPDLARSVADHLRTNPA